MRRDSRGRIWTKDEVMVRGDGRSVDSTIQPGVQQDAYDEAQRLADADGRARWVKGRDGGRIYDILDVQPMGTSTKITPR